MHLTINCYFVCVEWENLSCGSNYKILVIVYWRIWICAKKMGSAFMNCVCIFYDVFYLQLNAEHEHWSACIFHKDSWRSLMMESFHWKPLSRTLNCWLTHASHTDVRTTDSCSAMTILSCSFFAVMISRIQQWITEKFSAKMQSSK